MTNREYLGSLSSADIGTWLDKETLSFAPTKTTHKTDWTRYKNFKPSEFVCKCGKCKWSKPEGVMNFNPHTLDFLQFIRNYYKKAVNISCGVRCAEHNAELKNASATSQHLALRPNETEEESEVDPQGMNGVDFSVTGVTNTLAGRKEIIKFAKASPYYRYAYCNENGNYPNMGQCIHADFVR